MRNVPLTLLACVLLAPGGARAQNAPAKPPAKKAAAKAAPAPKAKPLAVTVKEVKGTAHRMVPGKKPQWVPLKVGDKLDELTVVRTGFRSRVVLQFADNSVVTIRRATKMGIAQFRKEGKVTKTKLGLKYGSVRADVEKARGPNDFTVKTPVATLAVTGSEGTAGYSGDIGFKSNCGSGGFTIFKGFQVINLAGTEGTNNQLAKSMHILQNRFAPRLGDVFGGLSKTEAASMFNHGGGRGAIGFIGGGLGIRKVITPPPPTLRQTVIVPGLDIEIGG